MNNLNLYAKAIAAFLTPLIVAALAWLLAATGVDVPFDPNWLETVVLSVITAIAVWAKPNKPGGLRAFGRVWR